MRRWGEEFDPLALPLRAHRLLALTMGAGGWRREPDLGAQESTGEVVQPDVGLVRLTQWTQRWPGW
jgi:hypothetical protein